MPLRRSAVFVAGLLLATAGLAAPPSDASIDELMEVSRMREQVEQTFKIMEGQLYDNMLAESGLKLPPAIRQRLKELEKQMVQVMREEMAWEKVRPHYRRLYSEIFTQEEISALLAFYRTPAGQSTIQKMPLLMQRSMQVTREQILPNMNRRVGQILADTLKDVLNNKIPATNQEKK